MTTADAYERVLEAATAHLFKLIGQASEYEKLNFPTIVEEYQRDHINPLREAIRIVKEARSMNDKTFYWLTLAEHLGCKVEDIDAQDYIGAIRDFGEVVKLEEIEG